MKNRVHHCEIDSSFYETLFGYKVKISLRSYYPADTLSEDPAVLKNQFNKDFQLQTIISSEDENIDVMNDGIRDVELGNLGKDLAIITITVPIKNRNKSFGQIRGEQNYF